MLLLLAGGARIALLVGGVRGCGGHRLVSGTAQQGVPQLPDVEVSWWRVTAAARSACAGVRGAGRPGNCMRAGESCWVPSCGLRVVSPSLQLSGLACCHSSVWSGSCWPSDSPSGGPGAELALTLLGQLLSDPGPVAGVVGPWGSPSEAWGGGPPVG